jgi:hypothetical protein
LVVVAQPQALWRFIRAYPELLVLFLAAHVQLLVAYTERLLVMAFIPVVLVGVNSLRSAVGNSAFVLIFAIVIGVAQGFYFQDVRTVVAAFVTRSLFSGTASYDDEAIAIVLALCAVLVTSSIVRCYRSRAESRSWWATKGG